MKIAILTLGTRGDVQPYAVLGKALKMVGHQVVLSTAKNFKDLVVSFGLDFVPVDADFQALLDSEEGKKIRKNPFLAKKQLNKFVYPMMADAFVKFYELTSQSDRVLFHVKTMADIFADQFPNKMIRADVIPASQPTREFPNPVFSSLPIPAFLNRSTYKLTTLGLKMWTRPVHDFRLRAGLPKRYVKTDLPSIYGISEVLLKRPSDYPENSFFTGFWHDTSDIGLSRDLLDFIGDGDAPLLINFGSMPFDSRLDLAQVAGMVSEKLEMRIILVKGWGISNTGALHKNPRIKVIDSAPYDQLFPLVRAIVHHGGIGTMAACLRAGKPFLTCPVLYPLGDQHFWGTIAEKKGVSPKPLPLKKLTTKKFIDRINQLLLTESFYIHAEKIAGQLSGEDGLRNAIKIIENAGYG